MSRRSIGLLLWGLAISVLGIWHVFTWGQNPDLNKDSFKLAVGIFCILIGIIVIVLNLKSRGKRKGE